MGSNQCYQVNVTYVDSTRNFRKALSGRNSLLKDSQQTKIEAVVSQIILISASAIYNALKNGIVEIANRFLAIQRGISLIYMTK